MKLDDINPISLGGDIWKCVVLSGEMEFQDILTFALTCKYFANIVRSPEIQYEIRFRKAYGTYRAEKGAIIYHACWDATSQLVATSDNRGQLRIWNTLKGTLQWKNNETRLIVGAAAFHPTGNLIAYGGRYICVFDLTKQLSVMETVSEWISTIQFVDDDRVVALSDDHEIFVYNTKCNQTVKYQDPDTAVGCTAICPALSLCAFGIGKTICMWNYDTGVKLSTLPMADSVTSIAFNSSGTMMAVSEVNDCIFLRNPKTGELLQTLQGNTNRNLRGSFHPSGKFFASGNRNKTVVVWDIETGKEVTTFSGPTAYVAGAHFSPDGMALASHDFEGCLRIWDFRPFCKDKKD